MKMGRGRRPRSGSQNACTNTIQSHHDDCNSPNRKEYKYCVDPTKNQILKSVLGREFSGSKRTHMNLRGGQKMATKEISSYFITSERSSGSPIDLTDENTCSETLLVTNNNFLNKFSKTSFIGILPNNNSTMETNTSNSNIFLQEPVLSLNIDKTTNQSPILIKKSFEISQNFGTNFACYENPLDLSKPTQVTEIDSTTFLNTDSNSCDSGVVIDKGMENSPSRKSKPITPHRIVCPSPIKHIAFPPAERKPDFERFKSRKRLIIPGIENHHHHHHIKDEKVNNTIIDNKIENNQVKKEVVGAKKTLTEFFPVRRSVRKTKKEVLEERNRKIELAVIEGKEDGLEVRMFSDKGRGIVAVRNFSRGEFVIEYVGDLISYAEAQKREATYSQDLTTGCYMYYFKHKNMQYCIDATAESSRLGRLVNHSRNGNLMPRTMTIKNIPRLLLYAKDDIKAGEEITYDYGDRSKESLIHHPWLAL